MWSSLGLERFRSSEHGQAKQPDVALLCAAYYMDDDEDDNVDDDADYDEDSDDDDADVLRKRMMKKDCWRC